MQNMSSKLSSYYVRFGDLPAEEWNEIPCDKPRQMAANIWRHLLYLKHRTQFTWCESRRASSLIRGDKRPTRCNRLVFYCKTFCLLNMFRAPLCPSSGALELHRWLLPVILVYLVYRSLVWCGHQDHVIFRQPVKESLHEGPKKLYFIY